MYKDPDYPAQRFLGKGLSEATCGRDLAGARVAGFDSHMKSSGFVGGSGFRV